MSASGRPSPTTTGAWSGVDAGIPWAFEPPHEHWRLHDEHEVAFWRSQPPAERLAQADRYRVRVHGPIDTTAPLTWRFVAPGG